MSFITNATTRRLDSRKIASFLMIAVFVLIVGTTSVQNADTAATLSIVLILLSTILDAFLPICLFACATVMNIPFTGSYAGAMALFIGLIAIYQLMSGNWLLIRKHAITLVLFFIGMLASVTFGNDAAPMGVITMTYTWLVCFAVAVNAFKEKTIYMTFSLFMSGIMVMYLVYETIRNGTAFVLDSSSGRLMFGEHVRTLANAIAFPIFLSISKLFQAFQRGQFLKQSYWTVFILAGVYILMLSVSRGVIFSVGISALFMYVRIFRRSNLLGGMLLTLAFAGIYYFVLSIDFDKEYFTNKLDTLTGRNDIWGFYFSKMLDGGILTLLFGFGPGDIKRIAVGTAFADYYAHSLFLSYLFSFGFLGFTFIFYMVSSVGKMLWRTKSIEHFGLFLLSILMFSTHGSCSTPLFYYLFGLSIGATLMPHKHLQRR